MTAAGRRAALLGKGALAAHAGDIITALPGTVLDTVIPTAPEPDWDIRLSEHAAGHWPHARIIYSGDWQDLEPGRCDLIVSVLYDKLLGPALVDATEQIINCHPGPLPSYRGVRPVNWALRNRETSHGITVHQIDHGIDSGPVLAEVRFTIWPEIDEVRDVWQRTMAYGRQLLSDTLPRLEHIQPRPQDHGRAVTHFTTNNDQLGDRADWTRRVSAALDHTSGTRS
ncbi:formyltransferase family protein [Amycolatopsis sp. CA-230715]|uniref:formyltransferase family protein n=1 Tax=Amycolatopsis sp. CA-230715 TaxID=2745196 RepID=UPI001C02F00F|nr:formyltransferase family protein [Amycolatopsis sp. CA-230715]QWF85816.1 Methionyl-tRNA formyltransferase [Amycolatopsis sp. CA-230715]